MKPIQLVCLFVLMITSASLVAPALHSRSLLPTPVSAQGVTVTQTNGRLGRNQSVVFIQPLFT
ncbi:MAG: hypothetical protein ACREAN_04255, partial [Nitrosopumilaceae archaeon]